jgi:hypothetical protein
MAGRVEAGLVEAAELGSFRQLGEEDIVERLDGRDRTGGGAIWRRADIRTWAINRAG